MKKLILIIIVVIAAAIPVAPYYIGTTVEQAFHIEHQEMAAEAALSGFDVELVDYQRRLFNATATTRISVVVPDNQETVSIEIRHYIDHTPEIASQRIATVDSILVLSDEIKAALSPLFKGEPPLSINTRIFLDGHQEASLHSPRVSGEITDHETVAIEWQGLQGTVWQSAARDRITFNMEAPGISASTVHANSSTTANQDSISTTKLHYEAELYKGASGMWHGKAAANIAAIDVNVTGPTGMPFVMNIDTIDMHGAQNESNGLVHASGVMTSKNISVNGFELTSATYDAAVENLDARALRAWQLAVSKMMKNDTTSADPFAPLLEQLPALVNAKPVIKINDLSVDSPMGRFAIKLVASINGEWNDMLLQDPAILATMLKADLDASVPRSVVVSALQDNFRQAITAQARANEIEMSEADLEKAITQSVSQQLEGLIAQGYIKTNNAQLESQLQYNAGQLTVNGMDASALIGGMLP